MFTNERLDRWTDSVKPLLLEALQPA